LHTIIMLQRCRSSGANLHTIIVLQRCRSSEANLHTLLCYKDIAPLELT